MEEHLYEYTLVSRDDGQAVMRHDFLETFFTLNRNGRLVYGIDGAPDEAHATKSLDALAAKLAEDMV